MSDAADALDEIRRGLKIILLTSRDDPNVVDVAIAEAVELETAGDDARYGGAVSLVLAVGEAGRFLALAVQKAVREAGLPEPSLDAVIATVWQNLQRVGELMEIDQALDEIARTSGT